MKTLTLGAIAYLAILFALLSDPGMPRELDVPILWIIATAWAAMMYLEEDKSAPDPDKPLPKRRK